MALLGDGSWNGNVMNAFSPNQRRILSLWLPRLPIDRIKRQFAGSDVALGNAPSVVVAKQNNALQIYALDDIAARCGLEIGLPLANARAICPELTVFDADEVADAKILSDIADWCDRFTPLVALDPPHGLLLDITGAQAPAKLLRTARKPKPSSRYRCPRSAPMRPSPAACAAPG
jgi:protein ImuB